MPPPDPPPPDLPPAFNQEARLERLLARHDDAVIVEAHPGRHAVVRRDQILVPGQHVPPVEDYVRRWYDSCQDEHGIARIRLRSSVRVDVCELAAQVSGEGRRRLPVSPNHLVQGQPMWWSGPADRPRPAPPVPAPVISGESRPVTIAVPDTGLSPHSWYENADWYAAQRDDVTEVLDADLDYELDAQAGHGTFIGGVLLQHAPSARLRAVRVLGGDGVGDELGIVRALSRLTEQAGADVINLSFGCYTYDDRPSPVVADTIARLSRGCVVVACAGNNGSDRPFWPAALKQVIAVAALGQDGDRAWFSNYGWWVDACAPGERIASCFVRFDGPRPRVNGIDPDAFRGFATWSGTSFAAPAVAGAIARRSAIDGIPAQLASGRVLGEARLVPDLGAAVDSGSSPGHDPMAMR